MSVFLPDARNVTVAGGSFNHVEGVQNNYHGSTTIIQKLIKQRTEFDEYYRVKRGAICRLKNIYIDKYPRRWDAGHREWWDSKDELRVDRTVCAARVLDQPGMMFTVMEYGGPEARKAFEEDFRMFSQALTSDVWQVYGYNDSNVPLLISYNELVPFAHLLGNIGTLGEMYLRTLSWQLECKEDAELWIDAGRGVICRGPPGPKTGLRYQHLDIRDLPSTTELLQEDVLLRFLSSLRSRKADRAFIKRIKASLPWINVPEQVLQPTIILTLTNTPIAIANNTWTGNQNLLEGKLLENGLTRWILKKLSTSSSDTSNRYTLAGGDHIVLWCNTSIGEAWMSQALSVFHTCGISLEGDLSVYKFVYQHGSLYGIFSNSEAQCKQRSQQPIYIFVHPLPLGLGYYNTSSVHFWSFDEDGQFPLPHHICNNLGLPIHLNFHTGYHSQYWSNECYKAILQYQLLQGFDPATTKFAQHVGFHDNIFQPVNNCDRFKEIDQDSPPERPSDMQSMECPQTCPQPANIFPEPPAQHFAFMPPLGSSVSGNLDIIMELETFEMDVD
ncbi:hypothetical protein PQX77_015765 [Marasmius sp. AFHP31]|nr:hypothetical protein PQX77_015765 [Marasmius sp. AFHP31]